VDKMVLHSWGSNIDGKSSRYGLDKAYRGGHSQWHYDSCPFHSLSELATHSTVTTVGKSTPRNNCYNDMAYNKSLDFSIPLTFSRISLNIGSLCSKPLTSNIRSLALGGSRCTRIFGTSEARCNKTRFRPFAISIRYSSVYQDFSNVN
jgi:hypothetical protein